MYITPVCAQYSMGVTGALNTPTADMQADGTFMAGINYLPEKMTPELWDHNTANYYLDITFLSFVEVAYRCTLIKGMFENDSNWEQDRSVSIRLRPLKEGKFHPSVLLGSNDAFTTYQLNPLKKDVKDNSYFSSIYGVLTKHIKIGDHHLGFNIGGYLLSRRDSPYSGAFGSVNYVLPFLKPVTVMAEYDRDKINLGAAARLFGHFSLHLFSFDFKAVSGGVRYEFCLIR